MSASIVGQIWGYRPCQRSRVAHKTWFQPIIKVPDMSAFVRRGVLHLGALATSFCLHTQQLPLRHYTTADGLAGNAIYGIAADSRGFLWFATSDGLSRFDGFSFTRQTAMAGLPHTIITRIVIGRYGNYWLATPDGLIRYRPDLPPSSADRIVVIRPDGKPVSADITALLEDRLGRLWCGTEAGLYVIEDTAARRPRIAEVKIGLPGVSWGDSSVAGIAEDMEGSLWAGAGDGTLYRRRTDGQVERYLTTEALPKGMITSLKTDRKGRLWVGRGNILERSRPARRPGANGFELLSGQSGGPPLGRVFDIFEARDGDMWVGIYRCLAQFPADGGPARIWNGDNGIPSRGIGALGQDRDGNLWMGTGDVGGLKLATGGVLTYPAGSGIGVDAVIAIAETLRGELYFSGRKESEGFRIGARSGAGFQVIEPRVPRNVKYFGWRPARVILQDRGGEWWLASSEGLLRYPRLDSPLQLARTLPKAVYTTRDGLPGDVVVRLYEDRGGNIWMGTETGQLGYWSRNGQRFVNIPADGTPSFSSAFAEDDAGNMWVADDLGQLWRVRDGRASRIASPSDKVSIHALLLDRVGRLWVATGGQGLLRFDDPAAAHPKPRQYGYSDGLSSLNLYSLAEDLKGFLYIGTGSGVDRLDPDLAHVRHYTSADGIAPGQVITAFRDRTGVIWFGTNHGLTRFVPRSGPATDPPPVWISGLAIAGRRMPVSEAGESAIRQVQVQPGQEQIEFDFVGLSYAPGNVLHYQYRLGNNAWSAPIEARSVHYGTLPPGDYRFAVRAINSDGDFSSAAATVEFRVVPALWRRAWFQTILFFAAITGTLLMHRARASRLLEIERVRTRIAADLHDDIGSSLSQIAILSEVAHQRSAGSKAGEPLDRIGTLSRELLDSISDIVWAIQPHKDHLSDLKQRMRRFAADVLSARNVEMHWSDTGSGRDFELNPELRRQVYLIFKESIHNIARHSKATQARIHLQVEDRRLALQVSDNGCGIGSGDNTGNGLGSMKLRAVRLGGELEIHSAEGHGTTVLLRAPLST